MWQSLLRRWGVKTDEQWPDGTVCSNWFSTLRGHVLLHIWLDSLQRSSDTLFKFLWRTVWRMDSCWTTARSELRHIWKKKILRKNTERTVTRDIIYIYVVILSLLSFLNPLVNHHWFSFSYFLQENFALNQNFIWSLTRGFHSKVQKYHRPLCPIKSTSKYIHIHVHINTWIDTDGHWFSHSKHADSNWYNFTPQSANVVCFPPSVQRLIAFVYMNMKRCSV